MKLLDSYLLKRLSVITFFAILVFTLSWIAPETMFEAVQGVSHQKLTFTQGVAYLVYQIPEVLTYCLPISILFGSVFLFRQLSLSGELTAILGSGISFRRLLVPIGAVGLGVATLFFLTQEMLIPWASVNLRQLKEATHFEEEEAKPPHVTFVERSPEGHLEKFLLIFPKAVEAQNHFIFLFYEKYGSGTRVSRMITAKAGTWDAEAGVWYLKDGVEYQLDSQGVYQHVSAFVFQRVKTSPVAHALLSFPAGNPSEFTLGQLAQYVSLLSQGGQTEDARFYNVRLYQRYFLPLTPIIFALVGARIGVERSRAKRNLGLTYAAVLLLFYNILVPIFTTLGGIGLLWAPVAAFFPVMMSAVGGGVIIQLRKSEG